MPSLADRTEALRDSVFATLAQKMRTLQRPITPLHIGDTYLAPPARLEALDPEAGARRYHYAHPAGEPALLEALVELLRTRRGMQDIAAENLLVSAGATNGLLSAGLTLFNPGDRVLVLAPYWTLITGILRCCGAEPVLVPFYDRLPESNPAAAVETLLKPHLAGARGLYFNTPNNPTGRVLDAATQRAVLRLAAEHDLWVLSDEAYADYVYAEGVEHVAPGSLPEGAGRTFSVYTFSKSHAMAGNRVGYVVGPAEVMGKVRKVGTHNIYCAPKAAQEAALQALKSGGEWQADARAKYAATARAASDALDLPHRMAEGGSFLFLDTGEDAVDFISRCLDEGVTLSPGAAFCPDYARYARLCFTAVPEAELLDAVARINAVWAAGRSGG